MSEQFDSLSEKTKLVDIAMKYTRGDIAKATEMVAGQYIDIIAVKCKFLVEAKGISGIFIAFFNYLEEYIANVSAVISPRPVLFEKTRIFDNWKLIYKDIIANREEPDVIDSQNFTYFLIDSFVSFDVFPDVHEHNLDTLTTTVREIIERSFNVGAVKCQLEFENTSSLSLELAGVPIEIPGHEKSEIAEIVAEDDRITAIEKEARYVIEAKAMVAPVRGKNVSDLVPGDRIKVILTGNDVVSDKVLKLLNAYDANGNRMPIPGRIKAKVPFEKGGYMIYAFVAKGVLAKIFEEENVKILLDSPQDEPTSDTGFLDRRIIIIMAGIVGLILLSGIILLQIL